MIPLELRRFDRHWDAPKPPFKSGTSVNMIVDILGRALKGGTTVKLFSNNTAIVQVPPTVVIPAGSNRGNFQATIAAVTEPSKASVRASLNGKTDWYHMPVNP